MKSSGGNFHEGKKFAVIITGGGPNEEKTRLKSMCGVMMCREINQFLHKRGLYRCGSLEGIIFIWVHVALELWSKVT